MKRHKVEGIVIRRTKSGEADRIVVFFTPSLGKVRAIGKGLRRIKSKRAPHLEIFSVVQTILVENRLHNYYIAEVELINGFSGLRKDYRKITIAYHLCEIVDKMLPEKEKNKDLYYIFLDTLLNLNENQNTIESRTIVRKFVYNLLYKLGYLKEEEKHYTYSQLIFEIENIIEKPLKTLRLLMGKK